MKKSVKYVCYFDIDSDGKCKRGYPLSAVDVILSKVNIMRKSGYQVDMISMSPNLEKGIAKREITSPYENTILRLFASIGGGGILLRVINRIMMCSQLICFFVCNIRKDDVVIVYHSLGYMKIIFLMKIILGFRFILEMQEIYGDVLGRKEITKQELLFSKLADAYIFPTKMLEQRINLSRKPAVIAPGTFTVEPNRDVSFSGQTVNDDNIIHCVYAGTLDPRKGCLNAVLAAAYLPKYYHIHILGFGSPDDKEKLRRSIEKTKKCSGAGVSFEGTLKGEEYIEFLQSCDIGLCTQGDEEAFNETSFPSKILSYLRNGLRVVSINIPAIKLSDVGDLIYYYEKNNPMEIADAIRKIDMKQKYDSRSYLNKLRNEFESNLNRLLEELCER